MSDKINDGGPAFPNAKTFTAVCPDTGRVQETYVLPSGGMSLRDWFAGQAMAAMVSSHQKHNLDERPRGGSESLWDYVMPACEDMLEADENGAAQMSLVAYELADAMLRARAKWGGA